MKRKVITFLFLAFCLAAVPGFTFCKCKSGCECAPKCSCIDTLYDDYNHPCVSLFEEGLDKCRSLPFLDVEGIYWSPRQGPLFDTGLEYSSNQVTLLQPNFKMRWGFKVGAGIYIEEIASSLAAKYTWFYNKQHKGKYSFTTTSEAIYDAASIGNAYANYFNRVDLSLSRTLCAREFFQFSSKAGLVIGLDEQWFDIKEIDSTPTIFDESFSHQKWWGIGPYAGFETDFRLPFCLPKKRWGASFFFNVGGGLPWSKTDSDYTLYNFQELATNPDPSIPGAWTEVSTGVWRFLFDATTASFSTMQLVADMSLGLKYEGIFGSCERGAKLSLFAAWEEQYWPNHIFSVLYDETIDYHMQGLTFGGKIQY